MKKEKKRIGNEKIDRKKFFVKSILQFTLSPLPSAVHSSYVDRLNRPSIFYTRSI